MKKKKQIIRRKKIHFSFSHLVVVILLILLHFIFMLKPFDFSLLNSINEMSINIKQRAAAQLVLLQFGS